MNVVLLLLFLASPSLTAGNYFFTAVLPRKMVSLTVRVDFGPAEMPTIEKEIMIPEGATPKEALKRVCPIEAGAACCHPAEVKGINGISMDPMRNRWWILKINGSKKNASPHKSHLKAGDRMEWIYLEDKQ